MKEEVGLSSLRAFERRLDYSPRPKELASIAGEGSHLGLTAKLFSGTHTSPGTHRAREQATINHGREGEKV